jgi:4-amino-4-deoxy-L-arabinose transferase-like glycosyltransferase
MSFLRRTASTPLVRPWALATPVLVFLVALPLLRPLRHPGANSVSDDEAARLATIAAVAEHHSLSLEGLDLGPGVPLPSTGLVRSHDRIYSSQPPVMAVILAGPYWVLGKFHLTLRNSPVLTQYLLTLIGVTIPVACASGLIYKMSRAFELRREIRCALAAAVVFGGGMISYAVVLNSHAPAATLVLASAACLVYLANSRKPRRSIWWAIAAGTCSGLAAALDPPAAVFPVLFMLVLFAMRWPIVRRTAAAALFIFGVVPPLYLHLALNYPITGDYKPAVLHRELILARTGSRAALASWGSVGADLAPVNPPAEPGSSDDEDTIPVTGWAMLARPAGRLAGAIAGNHGLLTHFPVLVLGVLGIGCVLRRHWPGSAKALAFTTFLGAGAIVLGYALIPADPGTPGFANRWFIVFLPVTLFWMGAWVRLPHRPLKWMLAGLLLAFSAAVSVIGATDPLPRDGYEGYTAVAALRRLLSSPAPQPIIPHQITINSH